MYVFQEHLLILFFILLKRRKQTITMALQEMFRKRTCPQKSVLAASKLP